MCIDQKWFNHEFFAEFFKSKPVDEKEGLPPNLEPIDVFKLEIDSSLDFIGEWVEFLNDLGEEGFQKTLYKG